MPEFEFRIEGLTKTQRQRWQENNPQSSTPKGPRSRAGTSRLSLGGAKLSTVALVKAGVVLLAIYALSQPVPIIDARRIRLDLPGTSSTDKVITVNSIDGRVLMIKGTVSDEYISQVTLDERLFDEKTLTFDDHQWQVSVQPDRTFEAKVALMGGKNTIQVSAAGVASKVINIVPAIPPSDIWTQLTWDGPGDIDLHLHLPNGEHCFFPPEFRDTNAGAKLDFDETKAYGPEHITMEHAIPGQYHLAVVYFNDQPFPERTIHWEVIVRLENQRLERRFTGELHRFGETKEVWFFNLP